jgi:hypothetical protein
MSDSGPLIVPVEVQAMVINNANMNFIRGAMDYSQLAIYLSPSPPPCQNDQGFAANNQGVYLMWKLPQALRHGQQNGGGLDFPLVPNRWMVVRVYRPDVPSGSLPPATTPAVTPWIIQSDFLDPSEGTSAFLDPGATTLTPTLIGKKIAISSAAPWQEPANPPPYFLKAVTESNPAFAAYQPFNENVFSIYDDLGTPQLGAGTISYFVLGWYSQSTADILSGWQAGVKGKDFPDLLTQLNWTASAPDTQSTSTSLYQGAAFGISWEPGGAVPASPKDGLVPQVAVGNTSVDGVVEFARTAFENAPTPPDQLTPQQAANLLEAFQYNLLPMLALPGAEAMIEQKIRSLWFGSAPAGTAWTIVDAQTPPGQKPPAPPTDAELANETQWLAALNTAQSQFDQAVRDLIGVQRDLFELWWKKGSANIVYNQSNFVWGFTSWPWNIDPLDPSDPNYPSQPSAVNARFDAAMAPLISQAQALMTQLNNLAAQIPTGTATISFSQAIVNFANTKSLPQTRRTLKAVTAPRFWLPGDPVVVISNTAHLLKIDPDSALQCRWPGELVSELNVSAASGNTTGPQFTISSSQLAQLLPAVNWTNLPSLSQSLFTEFFLLDPANAALVAAAANQNLTVAQIAAVALSMSPLNGANGIVPAVLSAYPCPQAWEPVYLDWEIAWFAIPFQQSDGTPNWAFNGLDYDLAKELPAPTTFPPPLTGRSVLTPKPSFEFKARLDQFITDYPTSDATKSLQDIEGLVQTVDGWDFLSQTLSGFSAQIAEWNPVPVQNPDSTPLPGGRSLLELCGDQAMMPPNPTSAEPPVNPTVPPSTFEGMRGGQFYINQLTIVDAFGQTLEIVFAPTATSQFPLTAKNDVFHPLLSDGVAPCHPISTLEPLRFVQLPPRLLQLARLNFNFTPGADGNPIVGWILPNHLDSGLSVYDEAGTALGELTLGVDQSDAPLVDWMAAPNSPFPTLPDPSAAQGPLMGFVAKLKSLGAGPFSDLLQAVDETLWTVDPLGNRSDNFLSVLIGRPLAVVAASISFELQAEPWRDPDWPYTFADPKPEPLFLNYEFPVRLGDLGYRQDGLIGYFTNGDYANFNAIHVPQPGPNDPPLSGYLKKIEVGNYIPLGFAEKGPGTPAVLTIIMDPRGSVHAQCGFLPVKEISLVPDWVDSALSNVAITFRTGPVLVGTQQIIPKGGTDPITALLLTSPAEQHGTWSWVESDGHGNWPDTVLTPVDGTASFPETPPTLREGLLKLTGGMDK